MTQFGYKTLGFMSGGAGGTPYNVQYLIVAGGGGGGSGGGGAGGGGMRVIGSKTFQVTTNQSYTVTVGSGGSDSGTGQSPNYTGPGFQGGSSVLY